MVYFSNGQITIRNMECRDAQAISDTEIEQGWDATIEKYQKRLGDQHSGKAISLVAEYSGKPVGYINIYPNSAWGACGLRRKTVWDYFQKSQRNLRTMQQTVKERKKE